MAKTRIAVQVGIVRLNHADRHAGRGKIYGSGVKVGDLIRWEQYKFLFAGNMNGDIVQQVEMGLRPDACSQPETWPNLRIDKRHVQIGSQSGHGYIHLCGFEIIAVAPGRGLQTLVYELGQREF